MRVAAARSLSWTSMAAIMEQVPPLVHTRRVPAAYPTGQGAAVAAAKAMCPHPGPHRHQEPGSGLGPGGHTRRGEMGGDARPDPRRQICFPGGTGFAAKTVSCYAGVLRS